MAELLHPHACGADVAAARRPPSPGRFIPTRVGRMPFTGSSSWPWRLHPHACGADTTLHSKEQRWPVTSPRVWGGSKRRYENEIRIRYIPTRVGRIDPAAQFGSHRRVTSPRVWGGYRLYLQREPWIRYIPTRVGRILPWRSSAAWHNVTSPRVWGGYKVTIKVTSWTSYIPTRVGRMIG